MVKIKALYQGNLHCLLTHGPSGQTIETDAPKDNMGKGAAFSPTDLLAASLVSCILTTMGIYAQKHGIDLKGAQADITKEMSADAMRRIVKLSIQVRMPKGIKPDDRKTLERIGQNCPVHKSLHPDLQTPTVFTYSD